MKSLKNYLCDFFVFNPRKIMILLCVFSIFFHHVKSDLPVHCLVSSIEGVWLIHMSNNNGDNNIKCGHEHPDKNLDHLNSNPEKNQSFLEKYQTLVQLERPNNILSINPNFTSSKLKKQKKSKAGNPSSFLDTFKESNDDEEEDSEDDESKKSSKQIGTWTMVYDEGFEMTFGNNVFFAFSRYEQSTKFTASNTDTEDTPGYKSICSKTFIGWYRNNNNNNWGCFWAEKITNYKKYNLEEINYNNIFSLKTLSLKKNKKKHSIIKKEEDVLKKENEDNEEKDTDMENLIQKHKKQEKKDKKLKRREEETNTSTTNEEKSSTLNYVDFLKNLMQNTNSSEEGEEDSMSSVPHLDIYFLNGMNSD